MPYHDYNCPAHGYFEIYLSFDEDVPQELPCQKMIDIKLPSGKKTREPCKKISPHVLGNIIQIKVKRSWEEKANIARANPADQMKAQLDSVKRAEDAREKHGDPRSNFLEGE